MAAPMRIFRALKSSRNLLQKTLILHQKTIIPCVTYAKKAGGVKGMKGLGMVAPLEKKELEVEEDPEKLVKFCCGANIYKDGQDPELKPDSEYPDWLWELRLDPKPILVEELDQDSWDYWVRLRLEQIRRNGRLSKVNRYK
ncbi:large ribosomal subunit protein mL54-like [Tubulanus polymorphus]|uniref:large ribosomal subunit protein mL54-like n=1 Tax=Tubulanus polymorphus TaxID=672921 RepID=UPI003DA57954